jgi:hypothetical protein
MVAQMNNKPFRMEYRGADNQSHESLRRVIYTLPGTMELLTDALNSSIELIFNLIEHNIPLTTLFNPDVVRLLMDADQVRTLDDIELLQHTIAFYQSIYYTLKGGKN